MSPIQIRLRELRLAKGLTQVQLAELCGMPQSTISRIESGSTTGVDFETLERVAGALGVHPSDLIVYGKIPFEYGGRSYIISDATAESESLPEGATAVWTVEGENLTFPAGPRDQPGDLIKKAKGLLDRGRG
jgi:transcriptional regulator with XRE-family HTH domain